MLAGALPCLHCRRPLHVRRRHPTAQRVCAKHSVLLLPPSPATIHALKPPASHVAGRRAATHAPRLQAADLSRAAQHTRHPLPRTPPCPSRFQIFAYVPCNASGAAATALLLLCVCGGTRSAAAPANAAFPSGCRRQLPGGTGAHRQYSRAAGFPFRFTCEPNAPQKPSRSLLRVSAPGAPASAATMSGKPPKPIFCGNFEYDASERVGGQSRGRRWPCLLHRAAGVASRLLVACACLTAAPLAHARRRSCACSRSLETWSAST